MTADIIKKIISEELKTETELKSVFGLDLIQCLVEPVQEPYLDNHANDEVDVLWTVLEEKPGESGYTIFYDPEAKMFGLGMRSDSHPLMNIGYYGTFLKTLYSM